MGYTANFCRLGDSDKLNIAGSNHTLWSFSVITYVLITTSRKYKHLRRSSGNHSEIKRCEVILKLLTVGVLVGTAIFLVVRF